MKKLLEVIGRFVSQIPKEKVELIAARAREIGKAENSLIGLMGTPSAAEKLLEVLSAWNESGVSADELAAMLVVAAHVYDEVGREQTAELVWTGPTTPFVSARRTEQALIQLINGAKNELFVSSFVIFDVKLITSTLNDAKKRGVKISIILEDTSETSDIVFIAAASRVRKSIPGADIYVLNREVAGYSAGRWHAKVSVADHHVCLLTSANLTGYAMDKNVEMGVLLSGGEIPRNVHSHLDALVAMKILIPAI